MKKKVKQVFSKVSAITLSLCMAFSGAGSLAGSLGSFKTVTAYAGTNYELLSNVQDAAILHCFNWSYKAIEDNMELIAQSGYSVIQTSPCTQGKDYAWEGVIDTCVGWPKLFGSGNWWKLYQPVAECVDDNGMSYLGSKAELQSMCAKADQYGIKVVVDIVANHMANVSGWQNSLADVSPEVGTYWNPDMLVNESYWHINQWQVWMSDGRKDFTQGTMGMPDLNTANKTVQRYIYEYLDELIDCGVDGFRFDAAKHIETPDDDASYASDFWPTVLNEAKSHYKAKTGGDLYVYGEVLNTVGDGFDIGAYTKYMSVTDNAAGNGFLDAVRNNNAGNISQHYASDKSVIWAESHDTYMNESSVYASDKSIVRAWAILANKDNAAKLFFVRPYDSADILNNDSDNNIKSNDAIGEVAPALMGEANTYVWCSKEVAAINHFNNRFAGSTDNTGSDGNIMYCQRGNGIVIVNFGGAGSISMGSHGLAAGTYKDEISGNTFTVSGGTLSGTIGSSMGIAVIYQNVMSNPTATPKAWVAASKGDGSKFAANSLEVSLIAKNCDSASYSLSTGESGTIDGSTTIVVGRSLQVGQSVTLTLTGRNSAGSDTRTYTYTKTEAPKVPVTGVSLNKSKLSIAPGATAALTANVAPADAYNTNVTWTSSDASVAAVDSTGVVTAKKNGEAVITVTTEDGAFTAKCTVTVSDTPQPTTGVVYYKNTNGWATPTAYMWNSSTKVNNGWPGVAMTKTGDGQVYSYEYDVDAEYNMIIFDNAGASQTADLSFAGDGYMYDAGTGKWEVYGGGGDDVAVTGVSLNKTTAEVNVNGTVSLSATVAPGNATNKSVTWSSSDATIAAVNGGVVTGKAKGTATITVTTADGGFKATCTVTVSDNVVVTDNRIYFKNTDGWSTPYVYMWKDNSSNNGQWPGVQMTALDTAEGLYYIDVDTSKGFVNIIFNNGGNGIQTKDLSIPAKDNLYNYSTGTWSYYSSAVSVTGVSLNRSALNLNKGETSALTATVAPANATNAAVTWSSGNTSVATVSASGVVTAVAKGTAVITVTTADGGFKATCTVTVNEQPVNEGWQQDSTGWKYLNADGTFVKSDWKQVGGKWYYFGSDGYMKTGWQQIGGKWYYMDGSGAMRTGWQKLGGKWYYLDGSGAMRTGWQKLSGKWYYLDGSGAMRTGWQKLSGKWYYFDGSGAMRTGWQKLSGNWYYFKSDGSMAANEWVDGGQYYVDSEGHWKQ